MGVVKGSKNVKINGTVKGSNSVRVDTARVNAQNATIRREYEDALKRINDYQGRIKDRKYLSGSDLDDMKSAIDTFEARGNTIRNLNSLGGYKYSDDDNKLWEDSISSLRSGYGSAKDLYSPFKTEDEFNKGMEDARIHAENMAVNVSESRKKLEEAKTMAAEAAKLLEQKNKALLPNERNNLQQQFEDLDYKVNYITGGRSLDEYAAYLDDIEKYQKKSNLLDFVGTLKNVGHLIEVGKKESGGKLPTTGDYTTDIDASGKPKWAGRGGASVQGTPDYDIVSEEERNNYYALLGYDKKNGTDYAKRYWDLFSEDFISREAAQLADAWDDNGMLVSLFSIVAGVENFSEGLKGVGDWFSGSTEKKDPTSVQMASADIREKQNWFGKTMYDLGVNIAQQAPSTMLSFIPVIGKGASLTTMGASAAGNAYNDAINSGMSVAEARSYSALVGGSEVVLEKLLGATIKGGGALTKKITAMIPTADKAFAKIAKTQIGIMASEFAEESLQTLLEPVFEAIATREDIDWSDTSAGDVLYSGLLGALSAGLLGNIDASTENTAANLAIRAIRNRSTGARISNVDGAVARLAEAGSLMSADSVAYKVAQQVNQKIKNGDKVGAYTVGKLFYAENAYLTDQNKADIVKSLTRKGVAEADARNISEWMSAVVNGAELNKQQQTALEDNPDLIQTYADVILNPNSTVNQRMDISAVKEVASAVVNGKKALGQSEGTKSEVPTAKSVEVSKSATTEENEAQRKISASDGGVVAESTLDMSDFGRAQMRAAYDTLKNSPDSRVNGMSQDTFYRLFQSDYLDAYLGDSYETILSKPSLIPESVRATAYEIGRARAEARKAAAKERQHRIDEAMQKKESEKGKEEKKKHKSFYDGDMSALTGIQRDSIEVLDDIFGGRVSIKFIISYTNEYGVQVYKDINGDEVTAPNGVTDEYGNIVIDLNSGDYGEGVILYSVAHELSHLAKMGSPERYEAYIDFLIENYPSKKGNTRSDEIAAIMKWSKDRGVELTPEKALDEFVARASEKMLVDILVNKDSTSLKKLAKSPRFFQDIVKFINELFEKLSAKIAKWYGKIDPQNDQAKNVAEIGEKVEKLREMWAEMVGEAVNTIESVGVVNVNQDGSSVSQMNSLRTWTNSEYITNKNKAAEDLATSLGVSKEKALRFIENVNSIAKVIANDRVRLDYEASSFGSAFVSNVEYGGSFDYTTLCAKRRIYTGTFQEIQKSLRDIALTPDDVLKVRNMLIEAGYEATCGLCYVEGSRANMGKFAKEFIRLYKRDNPNSWTPDMVDVNTPDGVEQMRIHHPECYEQYEYFWNHYGKLKDSDPALFASQQKPKLYEARKEYKGEILDHFKNDDSVAKKNRNGGIRMQSFSDFEIVHLIDTMQVIMDMSRVGLAGQAYTKVPEFAKAFGNTGLKINLSLIAKGVDANGKLIFDDREGMPHETAFDLRNQYSKNVGTILVIFTDEQLYAAMADPRIDFIIPFHRSQWKKGQYAAMGLPKGTKDYTFMQNEKFIKQTYHEYRGRLVKDKATNYMPNEYWDFNLNGKENAKAYLKMCAENNKRPKFYKLLDNNGDGSYSLKADGSTDGYWKLLIDFKMYDNDGIGSPQTAVSPEFNMDEAITMLNEYEGGHQNYPIAHDVVDRFVRDYKSGRKTVLPPPGKQFSLRNNAEVDDYSKPITAHDVETLRSIGRKSINDFTSEEIKKAQKWAYKFYKELGTKSPFFRAWFGEWRAHDRFNYVDVLKMERREGKNPRGTYINKDTGWNINSSSVGYDETISHSGKDKKSIIAMQNINKIIENAILLDTEVSEYGRGKKSVYTAFMHKFYAPISIDGKTYIAKMAVDESHAPGQNDTNKKFYHVRAIEIETASSVGIGKSHTPIIEDTVSAVSISDLYNFVKSVDKDFSPAPEVSKYVLNKDGTPKVFYHGTKAALTVFDKSKLNDRLGFYFTEDVREARDYGEPTGYYLNVRNPIDIYSDEYFDKYSEIKNVDEKVEALKADRYDGIESYSHGTQWIIAFDSTQIKSATDNIGTFDGNNSDIRYSLRNRTQEVGEAENALQKANAGLKADVEHFRRLAKLTEGAVFTKSSVEAAAKWLMNNNDVEGHSGELRLLLDNYYEKVAKITKNTTLSSEGVMDKVLESAKPVVDWIMAHRKADVEVSETAEQEVLTQVYDSYWRVKTLKAPSESLKAEINKLKALHKKQIAEMRKDRDEKIAEIKQKYAESRAKGVESRRRTEMRDKIKKVVSELNNLLLHGTKERNIKDGLRNAVAEALYVVNMDTVGAEERIAKYDELIAKTSDPDAVASFKATKERILAQSVSLKEKLLALKQAYEEIRRNPPKDSPNANYYSELTRIIEDKISDVVEVVGDTPIRDMSLTQLEKVYELYKMVLTTIQNDNKVFREGKLEDLRTNAMAVMDELSHIKSLGEERYMAGDQASSYVWGNYIPYYAFRRLGSKTLEKFFWDMVEAQNTYAKDTEESERFAEETRKKHHYNEWDLDEVYEYKLEDGRTFRATLKHIMSIYAYSKREQALDHMRVGGFFFNDKETFRVDKKVFKVVKKGEEGYRIDDITLAKIKADLGEKAKYVDEMQAYMTEMGKKGNEVSNVLWGIDIFKEKVYFPLKSVTDFVYQANQPVKEASLKNDGMTKETKPGASNPIVLESFDDVWGSHVERMSRYHAFVIPIENLNKIHNYGEWASGRSMSVSTMIGSRFTSAANEYLTKFIQDMNGAKQGEEKIPFFSKLFSKFKKTVVGASLSVVVQQPTAIIRATAEIDIRYFAGKPKSEKLGAKWEELKKYAPIAIIKERGGFDAGSGRRTVDAINQGTHKGLQKASDTVDKVTSYGAELADRVGWCMIWDAVKNETAAKHPDMDTSSEAFLQLAGKRATEVIVKTQVYDSTLARSQYMRSGSETMKALTAFGGEPTLTTNMLFDAITQRQRHNITKRQATRVISSVFVAQIAASVAKSAIYALRDEDEDESYAEKYLEAFGGSVISDLNPLTWLPVVRDVVSTFEGWTSERPDMTLFQDIKDAMDSVGSTKKSTWKKIEDISGSFAALLGLPLKNVIRTGREAYSVFENIFDGIEGGNLGEAFWNRGVLGNDTEVSKKLYDAIITQDKNRLKALRKNYKSEDSYNTAVKKALREYDPRIKEAAQARYDGNVDEYVKLAKEVIKDSGLSQDLVVQSIASELRELKGDSTSEQSKGATIPTYYGAEDINRLLSLGETDKARKIISELIEIKVANGSKESTAKASVKSAITKEWKSAVIKAFEKASDKEKVRLRDLLFSTGLYGSRKETYETMKQWYIDSRR